MCPEKDGNLQIDMDNTVVRGATVVNRGEITWPPPPIAVSAARKPSFGGQAVTAELEPAKPVVPPSTATKAASSGWIPMIIAALALFGLGLVAPPSFMAHFTVFVLSCFIGYMVIWNVSATLHTPLMSITNAISSIIILGAVTQISSDNSIIMYLSAFAIFITSINIIGGFSVTQRMLNMFKG